MQSQEGPKEAQGTTIRKHPGYPEGGQHQVITNYVTHQINEKQLGELREQGLSDEEIGKHLDDRNRDSVRKHSQEIGRLIAEDPEALTREDPLAGDVDPTGGYYEAPKHPFDAHKDEVARQHGDYTGSQLN